MGGGTGTGVAPIVTSVAKGLNALTFAIPIVPFEAEGKEKMRIAAAGVEKLRDAADFTIVLDNNRLTSMDAARDLPMSEAMKVIERSVVKIVDTVSAQTSSYVNTLMQDITGCVDALEEPMVMPSPNEHTHERMLHAEFTPTFDSFDPSMFG